MRKLTKHGLGAVVAVPVMGLMAASSAAAASETCNWRTARDLANAGYYTALCDCTQVTPSFLERLQQRSDFETTLQVTGAQCPGLAALLTDLPTASIGETNRGEDRSSDRAQADGPGNGGNDGPGDGGGNDGPGNGGGNDGPGDGGGNDGPGDGGGNDGPGDGGGNDGPGDGGGSDGPGKGGGKGKDGPGKGGGKGKDGPGKGGGKGGHGGGKGHDGPGKGGGKGNDGSGKGGGKGGKGRG
ncbi:hypothetical protein [Ruegeria sp.]|uniref:hypothetical protein n=1 Tax=Ruegeria sp. TaxID=1879320 RepID=UPI0023257B8E|nr:hypothetical protein [Ruegeria sp.]MDA7965002.1 hypothetical protein [Ruegeria sp.]